MSFGRDQDKKRKVRYAVVGLGWIAQEAVLPGFKHAEDNSELAAIVTDDPHKAFEVGTKYKLEKTASYEQYDDLLASRAVDAVYIALPNSMHRDFCVRAAKAGIHVLCEKPMASTVAECEEMTRACEENGVKLMIAYRLHFEPGNLRAVEIARSGEIGEPRTFQSLFTQQVPEGNIRLNKSLSGGPLMDVGIYCINAARSLFRAEPEEVTALGAKNTEARFREVHEMVSAVMRFPGDRLASFTCSFGAASVSTYSLAGTDGSLRVDPAYTYHDEIRLYLTKGKDESKESFSRHDQFGAELVYFSDCIVEGKDPEPKGPEGTADLRVIEGIMESMKRGSPVKLPPFSGPRYPDKDQQIELRPSKLLKEEEVVDAGSPTAKQ